MSKKNDNNFNNPQIARKELSRIFFYFPFPMKCSLFLLILISIAVHILVNKKKEKCMKSECIFLDRCMES